MSKDFRPWKIDEVQLLPPSVQDYVPKDHLSRFIVALVRESLDLSAISGSYRSALGQPPFDPRLMTSLLLHGYASGIYSSRRIAKAAVERADFMMIVAGDPPDFRTISEFRRRHLKALAGLFVQVLKLAEKAGLVKLGHVALDGTKIKANASKHKAMSYERMKKREAELAAEVDRWLKAAEAADAEEDKLYGDKRGDEMPDWVADKQKRLEKIRAAKAELEAEAKAAAEEEMRRRARPRKARIAEGRKKSGKTPGAAVTGARRQGAAQLHRSGKPHPEDQGRLHPGLQRAGCGRWRGADHRGAWPDAEHERPRPTGAAHRWDRRQSRPQAQGSLSRCRLLQRGEPAGPGRARHQRLRRHRTRQASRRRQTQDHWAADQGDARQAQAGRMAKPLPAQEANRRAGVRTDQASKRVQAVPVARRRESEGGMGVDLHRPQPHQARQSRLSQLSSMKQPSQSYLDGLLGHPGIPKSVLDTNWDTKSDSH